MIDDGKCLSELEEEHDREVISMDVKSNFMLSGDAEGRVVIWSLKPLLRGSPLDPISLEEGFRAPAMDFLYGSDKSFPLSLGNNFIARCDGRFPKVPKVLIKQRPAWPDVQRPLEINYYY